jgi:hypothetical protein
MKNIRDLLEYVCVEGRIILKLALKIYGVRMRTWILEVQCVVQWRVLVNTVMDIKAY